jgi:hypothetical protein
MKTMIIALVMSFALPTTFAVAGPMNLGSPVTRPYNSGVTVGPARPVATRTRNVSGNMLAPIAHDPSGSTLAPSAMSRGG